MRLRASARLDVVMRDPENLQKSDAFDLSRSEVRRRSLVGIFYITSSGFANLLIGFVGNLALARMLTPTDFGIVAVGATVTLLGGALADGGLGSGMIRRPQPPTRSELRTLNGIQLAIAVAICLPAALIALDFGTTGAVTAIMIASLPITTLQTPGRVVLTREMRFDRQAVIDFSAQTCFYAFSVATVALGAGVWGLATGSVVRAMVAALLTASLSIGFVLPSLRGWRGYGELVRFGLRFQASWLTLVAREQSINAVVAVVAGVTVLGFWTLANRLILLPILAFTSLYTVGFPAMSNLLARGEDPGPIILRTVRRASIVATLVFPAFAAASPELIPALFGEKWRDAADVIPWIALSTLVLGSISVAAVSYLNASGRPGVVAWASAALGVVWLAVTTPLLPSLGVTAIGVGNLCGAIVEALLLAVATRRSAKVAPDRPLLRPLAVGLVAGAVGWFVCTTGPPGLGIALAAGALTIALSFVGLLLVCYGDLKDTIGLLAGMFRNAAPRLRRASAERASVEGA
jgi:O-antigen/teichoic acid export membrane protein